MIKILPAIDILNGKVVRLTQGDYNRVDYYDFTPTELAKKYQQNGATRIHLVDLNGAKEGKLINKEVFESIRESVSCKLELGGGIRSEDSVKALLDIGIDYIILGSLLVKNTEESLKLIQKYPGKIIAGLDANNEKIALDGWTHDSESTIFDLANVLDNYPIESIIYTDIAKDGMLQGPNIDSLEKLASHTKHNVIASGGVSCPEDLEALSKLESKGIKSCIVGKALLENKIPFSFLKKK